MEVAEARERLVTVWWWSPAGAFCRKVHRDHVDEVRQALRAEGKDTWITDLILTCA
jgi:hypothetical protein